MNNSVSVQEKLGNTPKQYLPVIILCRPQLGENIGTAARAMLNCGLFDLRLVNPRDGWPNPKALNSSAGADIVIAKTQVFSSLTDAVGDLEIVYAATARSRDVLKKVVTPRQAAKELRLASESGSRIGILFGPERSGLNNEELELSDSLIEVPLNPKFNSLNLAQAVLLLSYEWYTVEDVKYVRENQQESCVPVDKRQLQSFFEFLDQALDERGFYPTAEMRPAMVRNIRAMFSRIELTRQDVQTLYGMIKKLVGPSK